MLPQQFATLCREVAAIRREQRRQRWLIRAMGVVVFVLGMLVIAGQAKGQPDAELAKAVEDVRSLPVEVARNTRYLSLYNVPPGEDRQRVIAAVSMLANSASRSPLIVRPQLVSESLLRIDLAAFGWPDELWEALVADGEPYWHLTTEIAVAKPKPATSGDRQPSVSNVSRLAPGYYRLRTTGGESEWYTAERIKSWIENGSLALTRDIQPRNTDGSAGAWITIAQLLTPVIINETTIVQTDGGWLPPADVAALRTMTASRGAIVRADWFVSRLCEPDHYYGFAGIGKTTAEQFSALGVNPADVKQLLIEKGTNIFSRGPTGKPGRIARFNSLLGGVWATYDVANANVGIKDPFRDPTEGFEREFDAGEAFVQSQNGLWQFSLYDGDGAIVGEADPNVATDGSAPDHDALLRAPISCLRCHAQRGEGGIIDLTYDQQRILSRTLLTSEDPEQIVRLQAFYGRTERLKIEMNRDREDADAAAREATGLAWNASALAVAQVHDDYRYARVDVETIRRELATAELAALLKSRDPLVIAAAANHGFAGVTRAQWETAFAEAIVRVRGREWGVGSRE